MTLSQICERYNYRYFAEHWEYDFGGKELCITVSPLDSKMPVFAMAIIRMPDGTTQKEKPVSAIYDTYGKMLMTQFTDYAEWIRSMQRASHIHELLDEINWNVEFDWLYSESSNRG